MNVKQNWRAGKSIDAVYSMKSATIKLNEPLEWDFEMEDAESFSVASSSRTVSLIILRKASTSNDADFTTEADASEGPSSDMDNKRL